MAVPTARSGSNKAGRGRSRTVVLGTAALSVLATGALGVATSSNSPAAAAQVYALPSTGTITVHGHGIGHGHGLSQYGANGAALAGLSATQIVAFYYPGAKLVTLPATSIRVLISGGISTTTVAATATLHVTGRSSALSAPGVSRYRLAPSGSGFVVQGLSGSTWTTVVSGLGAQADFSDPTLGFVRMYRADATATDYRGSIGAVRNSTGQITVNRLPLDSYVEGVVPREMPASWPAAAVSAQAIAARSYARNAVESSSAGQIDICDTDQCQVYGGMRHLDSNGNVLWTEDPAAVSGNANEVLQYNGATIFAQFGASDGGWTVDGGQPYLLAKQDPYDDPASGDPYLSWIRTPSVSSIASYYGLKAVTSIGITSRDGHGDWGGRVLSGYVAGISASGTSTQVATTGFGLANAMGLPQDWFTIDQSAPRVGTAGAATISSTATSVSMFYRDGSGTMQARTYVNGQGWQQPLNLGTPPGGLTWDPDAASWGAGHIDVVARDTTAHLVIRSFETASGWAPWITRPQTMLSSPAAVSPFVNSLYVFYLGPNHTLWTTRWRSSTGWSTATAVPGLTNAASGPDAMAAVETSKNITVDYRGTDARLWSFTYSFTSGWAAPGPVNPARALPAALAQVDPSVTDTGTGGVNYVYTGTDGAIYHSSFDPGAGTWSTWYAIPGSAPTTSAPDVSNEGLSANVIAGTNGVLRTDSWSPGQGWRPWAPLP